MRHVQAWERELREALQALAVASPVLGRPRAARRVVRALLHLGAHPYARRVREELREAAADDASAALVLRMLAGRGVEKPAEPARGPVPVGIRYTAGPGC